MDAPYDRGEVITACAAHAWGDTGSARREQLAQFGIRSIEDVKATITSIVDAPDCLAFNAQPQTEFGQTKPREIFSVPLAVQHKKTAYEATVILNPNRDENGKLHGGTLRIRRAEKGWFKALVKDEKKVQGTAPQIVRGGWQALRTREQHRQLTDPKTMGKSLDQRLQQARTQRSAGSKPQKQESAQQLDAVRKWREERKKARQNKKAEVGQQQSRHRKKGRGLEP